MRQELAATVLSSLIPFAVFAAKQAPQKPPYDADLFRKDTEVISFHGEFLYWSVQESAVDYAQKMNEVAASPSYAIGKVKSASYEIAPGLRCAVSYYNAPKYWEVRGQYTHLISRGKNRAEPPSTANEYLTGTWPQIFTNALVHAHSSIFFDYNLFDLSVARVFITNPHFRLKMVAGLGVAWMNQDWKVQYFDNADSTTIRNRWDYTGGGMRLGITGDWFWGNNIYLTGLATMGAYMGSYHNIVKQTATTESLGIRNSHFSDARPAYVGQFAIGPSWQQNFCSLRIEVFAGYELSAWFNLQEIRHSTSSTGSNAKETWINTSALALQGLTTRLTLDF